MKLFYYACALALAACTLVTTADAQVVKWSQLPDMLTGDGFSSHASVVSQSADDWLCNDPRPVGSVRWWGAFAGNNQQPISSFNITIYQDIPSDPLNPYSKPGSMLQTWSVTNFTQSWFGVRPSVAGFPAANVYEYYAALPTSFSQVPGTIYWLEVQAVLPLPPNWYWWDSRNHWNDYAVQQSMTIYGDGDWHVVSNHALGIETDLAFELCVVPEPTSLMALASGLLFLSLPKLRRR